MRKQEELEHRVALLENILDSINDGFFTLDTDFNFTFANHAFERICGYSKDEILGINYWVQFPLAKGLKFWDKYHEAFREQKVVRFEEYATAMGKWVSVAVYPTPNNLSVYFVDVSEAHKSRLTIEAQYDSLLKIAHMLSHEVRKPVASILGLAPLISIDGTLASNTKVLKGIIDSSKELDEVIKKMNQKIQTVISKK